MGENVRFWLAFVLSTVGATLLASLTLDPEVASKNFSGWFRLVAPPALLIGGVAVFAGAAASLLVLIGRGSSRPGDRLNEAEHERTMEELAKVSARLDEIQGRASSAEDRPAELGPQTERHYR